VSAPVRTANAPTTDDEDSTTLPTTDDEDSATPSTTGDDNSTTPPTTGDGNLTTSPTTGDGNLTTSPVTNSDNLTTAQPSQTNTNTNTATSAKLPKTKITKIVVGKKFAKLTFKKVNRALKVTRYQIQYRVKGTKKWKSRTVKIKYTGSTTARVTIKKLKAGKRYQFRIRAYKSSIEARTPANWSPVKASKKIKK
jgi:hypothetical protein